MSKWSLSGFDVSFLLSWTAFSKAALWVAIGTKAGQVSAGTATATVLYDCKRSLQYWNRS